MRPFEMRVAAIRHIDPKDPTAWLCVLQVSSLAWDVATSLKYPLKRSCRDPPGHLLSGTL